MGGEPFLTLEIAVSHENETGDNTKVRSVEREE
jgi:hypothetical protein